MADYLLLFVKQRGVTAIIVLFTVEKKCFFFNFGKSDSAFCV